MIILAIDTTGLVSSAALVTEEKVLAEITTNHKKTHSETLMPTVDSLMKLVGLEPEDIDYIACASGPGSFTGLRIGAAAAKGLARGLGKKIVPVPTLDALAYNICESSKIVAPIMDARRSQVYGGFYKWDGTAQKRIEPWFAEEISSVVGRLSGRKEGVIFLGDGVTVHKEYIQKHLESCAFAPAHLNTQMASSVGSLAIELVKSGAALSPGAFVPFYLRKSQAERELEDKGK